MAYAQYTDPSGMQIIEAVSGVKLDYKIEGTKISFLDGQMTLDLAKFEKDYSWILRISKDSDNCVTTGDSVRLWGEISIPARQYIYTPPVDNGSGIPVSTRTQVPFNMRALRMVLYRK